MSSKRIDLPDAPLCCFSFADGRRCTQPAHPSHDGFCFHHGTRPSARKKNLLRLLDTLMRKGISQIDLQNAFSGLSHEVAAGRMGRKTASTLAYLGVVLFQSDQMITENEFRAAAGPRWDYIHGLFDEDNEDDVTLDDRTIDVSPNKTLREPAR